jgi:predicted  nucleic acid-binding Zn-ribbon protein
MAMRTKTDLTIVEEEHQQAETAIMEAAKQTAPMVQRLSSHRERIDLAIKELESERFEMISRRDHLRRQAEALEQGFALHLNDIESTLKMYEDGLNSVANS